MAGLRSERDRGGPARKWTSCSHGRPGLWGELVCQIAADPSASLLVGQPGDLAGSLVQAVSDEGFARSRVEQVWRIPVVALPSKAVTSPWRRTGLRAALVSTVAATFRRRGIAEITTETAVLNTDAYPIAAAHHGGIGAGTVIEWERPA